MVQHFPLSVRRQQLRYVMLYVMLRNDAFHQQVSPMHVLTLSFFSSQGFTAALFSLPFDLVKSRLMNQRPDPTTGKMPYKGIMDASTQILTKEGPLGFFNGFSAYYGRCAPHAMIILLSIEYITSYYQKTML